MTNHPETQPTDQPDPPPKRPKPPGKRTKDCTVQLSGTVSVANVVIGQVAVTEYRCSLDTCPATSLDPDGDGWHFASVDGASVVFDTWPHFVEWVNAQ
jgi:hypothetical protein